MFADIAVSAIPKLIGAFKDLLEDPDTYKKAESLRKLFEQLTGREIDQSAFLAFLEEATQGEPYSGKWEPIDPDDPENSGRRLRVNGGYYYDIGRGNLAFNKD